MANPNQAPTTSRTYIMDKLTGPNYQVWKSRIRNLLECSELWSIVNGTELAPVVYELAAWKPHDL